MKRNEIIVYEHKKGVRAIKYNQKPKSTIEPPKPRNPVAKNAGAAIGGGAAGAHKDAKKASQAVRGQKHKNAELAEGFDSPEQETRVRERLARLQDIDPDNMYKIVAAGIGMTEDELRDALNDEKETGVSEGNPRYTSYHDELSNREREEQNYMDQERRDFKRQELQHELGHESNNIQVVINGKRWKVFPGKGYADSAEERMNLRKMQQWAERKSAATGKKWEVYLTGASPTVEATGDALGTVSSVTPDGKVSIKTTTGDEIKTDQSALMPGSNGSVQMKPDAAGDTLKPGAKVVSTEMTAPPTDSTSPIHGGVDHCDNDMLHLMKKLAGLK